MPLAALAIWAPTTAWAAGLGKPAAPGRDRLTTAAGAAPRAGARSPTTRTCLVCRHTPIHFRIVAVTSISAIVPLR
ncbi:MAG: hypothetical protein J3K34DRAFT_413105 [Monoraphidium minutum]|nr:MAG: hypothetical protein J3K34DRAFT_413105 [Monoraphidium minutum]